MFGALNFIDTVFERMVAWCERYDLIQEKAMLTDSHLEIALQGAIIYSPGNKPCVVHDVMDNLIDYQCVGEVWPESQDRFHTKGKPLIRTMDRHTFCEWFNLNPKREH